MQDQPSTHPVARLATRFYSDRRLIVLVLLLVVASGVSSLLILPRMEDPLLTQRAANVITVFPGADAQRVEALVTEKIEDRLQDIPEIKRMRSQSRAGSSFISIELRDDIYDTDPIWSSIRGKIEDSISDLPAGAGRPEFDELDIAAYAWIGAIVWEHESPESNAVLRRLAKELKDRLVAIDGTKLVDLYGDPLEEIVVEVDRERATAAGLTPASIASQLRRSDVKSSSGLLRSGETELVVEVDNQFRSLQDVQNAPLRSNSAGRTLVLSDVATVRRSTPEPPAARAIIDGEVGVVVSVMLRPEYRIDQWAVQAREVVNGFRAELPPGIGLDIIMEQEQYVGQRMQALTRNLFLGVSAVSLVTLFFMGWRSSLLVTATLPVAALMVLAGMRTLGIPIHQMSVTGLIIALGLLIDNAIIAADEIDLSLARGLSPKAAVADMVSRLFAPLLASTATTAFAFAPIALMEGPAGEFVGSIAITVILAIFSSFFLAMTVLPASAALLQRGLFPGCMLDGAEQVGKDTSADARREPAGFLRRIFQRGISVPWVTLRYRRFLKSMLMRPWMGVMLGASLPIAGFVAATQLNEQFFPPADRDQFYLEVELESQASIAETESIARQIDSSLAREPRILRTTWFLGESAPPFYYNIIARRKNSPNYAQAIVTIDDDANSLELIRRLQLELDEKFPNARLLVRQLEQGPPFDAPVELRVSGSDLDLLTELGGELRQLATELPEVLHTRTLLGEVRPVANVDIDAAQAEWANLSEADIAQQLFAQFEGLEAGTILEQVEEIPVRVRSAGRDRMDIDNLSESSILASAPTENGIGSGSNPPRVIPVSSIAKVRLKPQRAVITRYNGRRINEVQSFITAGTLPSKVLGQLTERIQDTGFEEKLPPGYKIEVGGEASERDAAVSRLMANVSVLSVGMVGALVLALASFRLAALIGCVATLSIGLGMGALWIFGYPFGFMAIVGTMGLIGIAINDSIVVVAALGANAGVRRGDLESTIDTVMEVTRHVLATTATTVVGFLPLLLAGGGFWPPLAVAIGTGVVGATLISLTLVPSALRILWGSQQPAPAGN